MFWRVLEKIFRFLSSLELAVFNILTLAVVLSIGTVFESKYGAKVASQEIYRSIWMQGILWLLLTNIAAVAFSRWPWKKHHVGFLITHLGLIVLLFGSFLTQRLGIDGSLALAPGESTSRIKIDENMLNVFRAVSGKSYDLLLSEPLDLSLRKPLKKAKEWTLPDPDGTKLRVVEFLPKAIRSVTAIDKAPGQGVPAFHYALSGSRANMEDWVFFQNDKKGNIRELGPARIRFQVEKPNSKQKVTKPTLFIYTEGKQGLPFLAVAHPKEQKLKFLGKIELQKAVTLGWMDFTFTMLAYHSSAIPVADYQPIVNSIGEAYQVIAVEIDNEKLWVELGAAAQIAKNNALYYVQYAPKQVDIGFELKLDDFKVGYYEGTNRAKSYESSVSFADEKHLISMNEPLKQNGFTFYQASFETDDDGKPILSVLSVNRDPGRWVKYLGSLMIVLGTLSMFYFKPKYSGNHKWLLGKRPTEEGGV